jgi:hypothetical protein
MISIEDFKVATFEKKCEHVTTNTTYVASRSDDQKKMYLYHSAKYFIEVVYVPCLKRVTHIQAFNDADRLLPYTGSVSLDDLML